MLKAKLQEEEQRYLSDPTGKREPSNLGEQIR